MKLCWNVTIYVANVLFQCIISFRWNLVFAVCKRTKNMASFPVRFRICVVLFWVAGARLPPTPLWHPVWCMSMVPSFTSIAARHRRSLQRIFVLQYYMCRLGLCMYEVHISKVTNNIVVLCCVNSWLQSQLPFWSPFTSTPCAWRTCIGRLLYFVMS